MFLILEVGALTEPHLKAAQPPWYYLWLGLAAYGGGTQHC